MEWLRQSSIALDQLINAFIFFGYADETLSARCYREHRKLPMKIINAIFFLQDNHCKTSFENEQFRKHLPIEYRKAKD